MKLPRYLMPVLVIAPVACALIGAPPAVADCQAIGYSTVCGQGNVRGGDGPAQMNVRATPFGCGQGGWSCSENVIPKPKQNGK